jgi:SAM-dependent methyltransferase
MSTIDFRETAADMAATAAFLEIAEELSLSALLEQKAPFTLDEAIAVTDIPEAGVRSFLQALLAAGLVEQGADARHFLPCADLADRRYEAGYFSWSLNANRPYLDHAAEFLREFGTAAGRYERDGRRVAVSSSWIGSRGFYPGPIAEIISRKPQRIVDLGAGAGALLIHLLTELPGSTGVALDISATACEEADRAALRAQVHDRLTVVNRSIESLVGDPGPVRDADVVQAGFALHDVASDAETFHHLLVTCRDSLNDGGCLVVTDAVSYMDNPREQAFSALFTYLHADMMGVRLPSEDEWLTAFRRAGFSDVTSTPQRMPGSRMFVATGRR